MLGAKGFRHQEHISFKDVVRQEINRPLSHWELMVNQSKVATALGRRVFDEEEILNNDDSSSDEEKEKVPKKKVVESRYLDFYKKNSPLDDFMGNEKSKLSQEVRSIQERPSEFGLWDNALNPLNVVKANQRQPIKMKHSPLTAFDEQLRHALETKEKTDEDREDQEDVAFLRSGRDKSRKSLKDHTSTGKYLHENDILWCKKFTKMNQREIIKWFKRFRLISPKGKMTRAELEDSYEKLFIGHGKAFADLLFEAYELENKSDVMDFKDYLIIVEVSMAKTHAEKLYWLSRILDLNRKGFISMYRLKTAIGILDCLQDRIPDENYDNAREFIEAAQSKQKPKLKRSVEERLDSLDRYLNPDYYGNIRIKEFRAIPARYISACDF